MKKLGLSYAADGNIKWYDCCGKVWQFLKELNMELVQDPATPPLGIYTKELKAGSPRAVYTLMVIHNS